MVSTTGIADALGEARGHLHPHAWLELCLDVLVHIADADGGALIDQDGSALVSVGMSSDDRKTIAPWLSGPGQTQQASDSAECRAAFTVRLGPRRHARLALWWREHRGSAGDAGAVERHGGEITALLETLSPVA